MPISYSNAPLCTIDVSSLKASRFLLEATRQLPFRDAEGNVNFELCERSVKEAARMADLPQSVADTLRKYYKAVKQWNQQSSRRQSREPNAGIRHRQRIRL